jgi:hypothetical protein
VKEGVEGETDTRDQEEEPGAEGESSQGLRNNRKMESTLGMKTSRMRSLPGEGDGLTLEESGEPSRLHVCRTGGGHLQVQVQVEASLE